MVPDGDSLKPGANAPAIDDSIATLQGLVELWRTHFPSSLPVLEGTPLRGFAILAHVDHAAKLSEAIALLAGNQLYVQAVPLVRMVLECAVTAAWLATTEGSGESALHEGTRLRRAYAADVAALTGADLKEALTDLDSTLTELAGADSTEASKFRDRCHALAGGDSLYVAYRRVSELSHAGVLLVDHYFQRSDSAALGFEYVQEDDIDGATSRLGLAVWCLHIAISAWDSLLPVPDVGTSLRETAARLGFSSTISRKGN